MKKRFQVVVATLILFVFALTVTACDDPPPTLHTKQTLLSGTVVATFVNPQTSDLSGRYLMLEFTEPGAYTVMFALGPSEPRGPTSDRDKPFIPSSRSFNATEKTKELDIALKDWPTYFELTVRGPDLTSDSVEIYSN